MALCGLLALAIGFLAGWRFRVMVLLPLEGLAMVTAFALLVTGQVGGGQAMLGFTIASLAMQIGYGLALACPFPSRVTTGRHPIKA